MKFAVCILIALALAGCAGAGKQGMRIHIEDSWRLKESDKAYDVGRAYSRPLRYFRVLAKVECNQYVYTELPVVDPESIRRAPQRMWTVKSPLIKCADVLEEKLARGEDGTQGADAIIYDARTFELTDGPSDSARPEHTGRNTHRHTTNFFSGVTGMLSGSTGAYLKGWAIAYVDNPTVEELQEIVAVYRDQSWGMVGRRMNPNFWDVDISRVALRQYEAALAWLSVHGDGTSWDWRYAVRQVLPKEINDSSFQSMTIGAAEHHKAAVKLLAASGDHRFDDIWIGIVRAAKDMRRGIDGTSLVAAGNILACSTDESTMQELKQMHRGFTLTSPDAYDIVMMKILATYRARRDPRQAHRPDLGPSPYSCPPA